MTINPSYSLMVNGTPRYSDQDQWTVNQSWGRHGDTATFLLTDEHPGRGPNFVIRPLDTVTLTDVGTGALIFGGLVTKPQYRYLGPTLHGWTLNCRDFSFYADKSSAITATFLFQQADAIIRTLVAMANCGITANHVSPGPTLPRVSINFLNLTEAINHVSKLASQSAEYGHYIDANLDVHWFDTAQAQPSGVTFTDVPNPAAPAATAAIGYYDTGWGYDWDAGLLATSCLVRGAKYRGVQTDYFVSNGAQASWPLTYEFDDTVTQAQVYVGPGTARWKGPRSDRDIVFVQHPRTVTIQRSSVVAGPGVAAGQWQVVQNTSGQWFLQPGTDPLPPRGTTIKVVYNYTGPIVARADNLGLQQQYAGPNRGVFQTVINDTTLGSTGAALGRAQREVQLYSPVVEKMTLTSTPDFPGHVDAGTTIRVINGSLPDAQRGYVTGINALYLVTSQTIQGLPGNFRTYSLNAQRVSVT